MLPDLPKLKDELQKFQKDFIHQAISDGVGPFKRSTKIIMFEGNRRGMTRPTGEHESRDLSAIEGQFSLDPTEDDLETTFTKLYDLGIQMGQDFQRRAFEDLNTELAIKGQSVDAKGLSPAEWLLQMLHKIEYPLGQDGEIDISGYEFVGDSNAYIKAWEEIYNDPNKIREFKKLVQYKTENARLREANRKLVG